MRGNRELLTSLSVLQQLNECSNERRWSSEQHHVNMRYYWQDGLLGEDEDELRVKYAAGVKAPLSGRMNLSSEWRVFKRAQSEGEEDGRSAFFRLLESHRRKSGAQ